MRTDPAPSDSIVPVQFEELAGYYDELMDIVPYDQWADYAMTLFRHVGHRPRRVLDCACGTGNLTLELAGRGLDMTGVDLSAQMIAQAQTKSDLFPIHPPRFFQGDLATFSLQQRFDSATCFYDSLNYITEPARLTQAFANILVHMEPKGIFAFDLNSERAFELNLFTQSSHNPRKSLHYDWTARFNEETRICTVTMQFEKKLPEGISTVFRETHQERAYSMREIERMLASAGWRLLRVFDAYTLNPPTAKSERWFFVAQCPA